MCLAVPARIVQITGDDAIVDAMGNQWPVRITLCPGVVCGQLVLIHAGFAIAAIDEERAREIWPLIAEIDEFNEEQTHNYKGNV
jgi:hydrogenase expression/formation protein HypC